MSLKVQHKHSVYEVYSNSFHKAYYAFGIYDDKDLAEEVCAQLVKDGVFSASATGPEYGVREIAVYGRNRTGEERG